MDDFSAIFEPNTEPIQVVVMTATQEITGNLYLSKLTKDKRRLTTLLNSDRRFIALTEARVKNRATGQEEAYKYEYIQINLNAVEIIKPAR